jgi:hypothetical protein
MSNINESNGSSWSDSALYKISILQTDDSTELLPYYNYKDTKGFIVTDTRFYGNHIFLLFTTLNDDNEEVKYLIRYDLDTNEWVNLSEKLNSNITSFFTIFNEKLIYASGSKIFECDFNAENQNLIIDFSTEEFKEFNDYDYFNPLTNDGNYVIITAANDENISNDFIFYDKDNNIKVCNIETDDVIEVGCDSSLLIYKNGSDLSCIDKTNLDSIKPITIYTI